MVKSFIETNDFVFATQLHNFHEKLSDHGPLLGFTDEEINRGNEWH